MRNLIWLALILTFQTQATADSITLYSGFVSKVQCQGKLLISSIGSPELIVLEAIPASSGCGVILKPLQKSGVTNLVLETSVGSYLALVEITPKAPTSSKALGQKLEIQREDLK